MNADWEKKLLEAAKRSNEEEEKEFLRLVDMAEGNCSLDTVRSLMKTFSAQPDYGTQERVESVLATAKEEDVTRGILEELPRLLAEAPEWAESLVGIEVDNRLELLSSIAATIPDNVKNCLRQLTQSDEFVDFYPAAKNLSI
jgi:hypothetical protein